MPATTAVHRRFAGAQPNPRPANPFRGRGLWPQRGFVDRQDLGHLHPHSGAVQPGYCGPAVQWSAGRARALPNRVAGQHDAGAPWLVCPVRLPMVKACVRAMDAISEFVATLALPEVPSVDRYVIAGGSKRGWYGPPRNARGQCFLRRRRRPTIVALCTAVPGTAVAPGDPQGHVACWRRRRARGGHRPDRHRDPRHDPEPEL